MKSLKSRLRGLVRNTQREANPVIKYVKRFHDNLKSVMIFIAESRDEGQKERNGITQTKNLCAFPQGWRISINKMLKITGHKKS